jgi:hypothetical protein
MPRARPADPHGFGEALHGASRRKPLPHEFVLDALSTVAPVTRPMFGCVAVYVEDKIVLILRDKPASPQDNGVWLATTREQHESLRREFPAMRSIRLLGEGVTSWQVLPADDPDFEDLALRACKLVLQGDPRIGKVPKRRSAVVGRGKAAKVAEAKPAARKAATSRKWRRRAQAR